MSEELSNRRRFIFAAAASVAALAAPGVIPQAFAAVPAKPLATLPVRQVRTDLLDIGYHEAGPAEGRPIILLHGFPYDIHSYVDVAPMLAEQGFRVIVPYLRGFGTTRLLSADTPRAGQQAAVGQDVIELMNALDIPEAVLAGYDWGGRAACVVAAIKPSRCIGLVSANGYLIQDIARAGSPLPPAIEHGLWYQYYFQTERGRAGLQASRRELAHILWKNNSPTWHFSEAMFERSAAAFDNPDFVDIVIHSYRHRLGLAPGYPQYDEIEKKLASVPPITVPTITLDGLADGVIPATDGRASAANFTGYRVHRQIPDAGHNLPQEAPKAFADACAELARNGKWRT